jgi:hypothetical protein
MKYNDFSHVPVSELTKEQLDYLRASKKDSATSAKNDKGKSRRSSRLRLAIIGIFALATVVTIVLLLSNKQQPESQPSEEANDAEVVWEPTDESNNPANEYAEHQQTVIEDSKTTPEEKLEAQLSIANLYSVTERYQDSQALLDSIDRTTLSHRGLFNLYSSYVYLYEHSGDQTAYDEYSKLVEDELSQFWDEETSEK